MLAKKSKGYQQASDKMLQLAKKQKGFIGITSSRDKLLGITISYWDSLQAIENWKKNSQHLAVKKKRKRKMVSRLFYSSM